MWCAAPMLNRGVSEVSLRYEILSPFLPETGQVADIWGVQRGGAPLPGV